MGDCRLERVCDAGALPPGAMLRVDVEGIGPVALYNVGGELYASDDTCTHAEGSLSEGDLDGDVVVCPVHFGFFHVPTGKALGFPATEDLRVHPVVVDGDSVFVAAPGGP